MKSKSQIKIGAVYTMKRRRGDMAERVTALEFLPGSHTVVKVRVNDIDPQVWGKENAFVDVHISHLTAELLPRFHDMVINDRTPVKFDQ
jgi:hypothetical protein